MVMMICEMYKKCDGEKYDDGKVISDFDILNVWNIYLSILGWCGLFLIIMNKNETQMLTF